MWIRSTLAAMAVATAAIAGLSACGSDDSSTSDGSTASSAVAAAQGADASGGSSASAPSDLDSARAQQILRTVVDPTTAPDAVATIVDSTDPAIGQKLNGFAKGATAGGYTPDVFTVTSVRGENDEAAAASVAVAGPHTPQPVVVTYEYTKVAGQWKLSSDAATALLGMASGPR